MGMPVSVEIADASARQADLDAAFDYFTEVDERFSTYKEGSEISRINRGELDEHACSPEMKTILHLSEETKRLTNGYFDIRRSDGAIDPSGLVKGWAIRNAAELLKKRGFMNFYVDAGGDIQTSGRNAKGGAWRVGIRDPFDAAGMRIVKTVFVSGEGVATSGTYLRGQHIYDPHRKGRVIDEIVSLTVIGPDIYEADRFATAAFAMGRPGIEFIGRLEGFEGYMIDKNGIATMTGSFERYAEEPPA